jgi:TolB-like protein/Tfp pilus assembly protein PilF
MKRCPECRRDYVDDNLLYCLEDGVALVQGSVPSPDEPMTAIMSEPPASVGGQVHRSSTRAEIHTTEQTAVIASTVVDSPKSKSLDKRWFLAALGLLIILLGGAFGYRYLRPGSKQIGSLAVMPFVNDSGSADVEYLSDGMTETLISSLSRLPALNVKPRSMVFRYKGKEIDLQAVGKELGVEAILSGRLVSRGNDISLFAELVDVSSTKVVWSRQYSRKQSDLVTLQSEIARDISSTLKSGLSAEDERKVTQNGTDNPEAYRLYLRGRSLADTRRERDIQRAIDNYEQAIALDPNYAPAYLALSAAHQFMALYGSVPASEALVKSRAAMLRALELMPNSPAPHGGLAASELFMSRDFAASEREALKALELDPNNSGAHRANGMRLAFLGRLEEALAELQKAIDADPTNATIRVNHAWVLFYLGRIDESDAELKVAQEMEPTAWFVEFQLFINSRKRGDHASAVEHLARAQDLRDEPDAAKFIRDAFKTGGWDGMMRASLADPEKVKVWKYYLATFAAELGDKDRAFALLDKSADQYEQFVLFAKIDSAMEPLRSDARYGQLLSRLGLN